MENSCRTHLTINLTTRRESHAPTTLPPGRKPRLACGGEAGWVPGEAGWVPGEAEWAPGETGWGPGEAGWAPGEAGWAPGR
jgi:hypothetical protein